MFRLEMQLLVVFASILSQALGKGGQNMASCLDYDKVLSLGPGVSTTFSSDSLKPGTNCLNAFAIKPGTEVSFGCDHLSLGSSELHWEESSSENVIIYNDKSPLRNEKKVMSKKQSYNLYIDFYQVSSSTKFLCHLKGTGRVPFMIRAVDECGIKNRGNRHRIVGGVETGPNEFPWQILLRINGQYKCGGTVIGKKWVMCAAHCGVYTGSDYSVVVGEHDRLDTTGKEKEVKVKRIVNHPDYRTESWGDYSLMELSEELVWSHEVKPACLPRVASATFEGVIATTTGWGLLSENGGTSVTLQKVDVEVQAYGTCEEYVDEISAEYDLCAAAVGKDSCAGDSGGPLVTLDIDGRYILIGVVSRGLGCARALYPGVYSRITTVLKWIEEISGIKATPYDPIQPSPQPDETTTTTTMPPSPPAPPAPTPPMPAPPPPITTTTTTTTSAKGRGNCVVGSMLLLLCSLIAVFFDRNNFIQ